jgi:hypothetical protein
MSESEFLQKLNTFLNDIRALIAEYEIWKAEKESRKAPPEIAAWEPGE